MELSKALLQYSDTPILQGCGNTPILLNLKNDYRSAEKILPESVPGLWRFLLQLFYARDDPLDPLVTSLLYLIQYDAQITRAFIKKNFKDLRGLQKILLSLPMFPNAPFPGDNQLVESPPSLPSAMFFKS